jgi:hypothetical protein
MNRTLIIRLSLIALFLLLAKWGWNHVKGDDGMMMFYFVVMGVIGGSLFVKYVLPWFGDAVGTVVFSSGEEVQVNESLKAAAKLAQGDYEGAISEHEKALHENPMQTFPAAEIAKICAQKLNDPQRGLQVLQKHLASQTWPEDDAAFLRFRMVDIQLETLKDFTQARQLLEQIIADFPNTRHGANANHKLHELEQEEYKLILAQRAKNTPQ